LSFLNSLADFDWNTFFVFQLSIILAAGILSGGKSAILKSNEAIEQRLLFIFLSVLIILLGLLNVLTNLMIADGQANLVVKTFPYFYMQNADLQKNKNLTKKNLEKLYSIYKYDPDFLAVYADRSTSENRKLEVYSQLDEIANWNLINTNYLKLLKSRNEYEIIGKRVYKAFQEINSMKQEESNITYQLRKDLASYLKLAADFELQRGNIDLAVLYYQEILKVQKWAFHVQRPFFLDSDISLKYLGLFLVKLNERRDLFGKNRDEVQSWLIAKIFENVVSSDTEKVDLALFANYFTQEELVIKVGE
jgi:hypothetical protein